VWLWNIDYHAEEGLCAIVYIVFAIEWREKERKSIINNKLCTWIVKKTVKLSCSQPFVSMHTSKNNLQQTHEITCTSKFEN
jgi:hypothetical protein